MSFEELMRNRDAATYAEFVLPSIGRSGRVLDVGCGPGSITVGLAALGTSPRAHVAALRKVLLILQSADGPELLFACHSR